jgi:hypothetical protein
MSLIAYSVVPFTSTGRGGVDCWPGSGSLGAGSSSKTWTMGWFSILSGRSSL